MANVDNAWVINGDGRVLIDDSTSEPINGSVIVIRNVLSFQAGATIQGNAKSCPATNEPCYNPWCLTTGKCAEND